MTYGKIPNLVLKRILKLFLKIPPLRKILEFKDWKTAKLIQKKKTSNQKLNQWFENLQDELYQLENKQTKGAKLGAVIRYEVEGKKYSIKLSLKYLVNGIRVKLVSNCEQNTLYNES